MPPLAGPERHVVLHAVAGEDLDLAVVHLDRARDDDLPLGVGEHLPDARLEIENAGRPFEFLEHAAEQRCRVPTSNPRAVVIVLWAVNVAEAKRSKVATLDARMSIRYPFHEFLVSFGDIELQRIA